MVRFTAYSDGKVLVPDEAVELPRGRKLLVSVELIGEETCESAEWPAWLQVAREISRLMPNDLPEDLAEQHDHYIHGRPKLGTRHARGRGGLCSGSATRSAAAAGASG